jgi:hypothetical protein
VPIDVLAIEVQNDAGADLVSTFQSGSTTTESTNLSTSVASDLILFLGADSGATFSSWGTGQTGISGYATPPTNITPWGSYQTQAPPGAAASTRTVTGTSITWAAVSVAIRASSTGGTVYCQAGIYVLKAPIGNTGNYQSVIFEPGSTITGVHASLNPGGNPLEALIWIAQDVVATKWWSRHAYHHIAWMGNGCQINLLDGTTPIVVSNVLEYTVNGPLCDFTIQPLQYGPPALTDQAHTVEVDGFEVLNLSGNLIWFQTNNLNTGMNQPDVSQQAHNWRVSNIAAHDWSRTTSDGYLGRVVGISSVRLFHLDRILLDLRNAPNTSGGSVPFFVFSARGDTAGIVISNSVTIRSNAIYSGQGEEIVELQGSAMTTNPDGITPVSQGSTSRVLFDNCVFMVEPLAGYPAQPPQSAYGNAFIDDDLGANNSSFISDFEFRNCDFANVAINFSSNGSAASRFGFARFNNCRFSYQPPLLGTISGASSSGTTSLATPLQTVKAGGTIIVQVAMSGSSLTQPSVTDSQSGSYALQQSGNQGAIYLWTFAREGTVSMSPSFKVTVTPGSSSSPIEIVAIELLNEAAVDFVGLVSSNTTTTEQASIQTFLESEFILFLGADNGATFSHWGTGQTPVPNYPTPPSGLTAWGSYQIQLTPNSVVPQRFLSGSGIAWVAACLAIGPKGTFSSGSLAGRGPFYSGGTPTTVSGIQTLTYTNNRGFDEWILIDGTNVTEIDLNGAVTGQTFGQFFLRTGDTLTVKYSSVSNYTYVEIAK